MPKLGLPPAEASGSWAPLQAPSTHGMKAPKYWVLPLGCPSPHRYGGLAVPAPGPGGPGLTCVHSGATGDSRARRPKSCKQAHVSCPLCYPSRCHHRRGQVLRGDQQLLGLKGRVQQASHVQVESRRPSSTPAPSLLVQERTQPPQVCGRGHPETLPRSPWEKPCLRARPGANSRGAGSAPQPAAQGEPHDLPPLL